MDTGISGNHTSAADMSAFHNCPRKSIFFTEMLLFCTQILPFFAWLLPVCTWMLPFCKGGEGEIFSAVSRLLIYASFYAFQVFFQWLQYIDSHKMRTNPIKWSNTLQAIHLKKWPNTLKQLVGKLQIVSWVFCAELDILK